MQGRSLWRNYQQRLTTDNAAYTLHTFKWTLTRNLRYFKRDGYRGECKDISMGQSWQPHWRGKRRTTLSAIICNYEFQTYFLWLHRPDRVQPGTHPLTKAITMCARTLAQEHYTIIEVGRVLRSTFHTLLDFIRSISLSSPISIPELTPKSNSAAQTKRGQNQTTVNLQHWRTY